MASLKIVSKKLLYFDEFIHSAKGLVNLDSEHGNVSLPLTLLFKFY